MHDTFAARAGRWSTKHRGAAIGLWLAFVIAAVAAGGAAGLVTNGGDGGTGESAHADRAIASAFPDDAAESVLIQAPRGATVSDPRVRAAVADVIATVRRQERVARVVSPYSPQGAKNVSGDRRSALVTLKLRGDDDQTQAAVGPLVKRVRSVAGEHPAVFIGQFGDASADAAIGAAVDEDFQRAEVLSLPLTLAILLLAFGSLIAAGIPLLLGITSVMAALGVINLVSHVFPMVDAVSSVILLVGLAVGVDYSLFYLRREREERARGRSSRDAIAIASATSGRAVIVSGLTVMVAMAGMLLAGDVVFTSLGVGAIIVVAVAMIGSVTVVPATLAALGDRVERGRIPLLGKRLAQRRDDGRGGRAWSAVVGASLRRPLLAAVLSAGLLVALAIPAFSMHTALPGTDDLPRDLEVMRVYDRMQAAFPGGQIPAVVVVRARDVEAAPVRAAIGELERRAVAGGHFAGRAGIRVSDSRRVAIVSLPIRGDGTDARSAAALEALRAELLPATLEREAGVTADVTGMTAATRDFNEQMKARAPLVFAFVLGLAFLVLLVGFRSIVVPIKAIMLNLLSVAAAYGVLVWGFQYGNLERPLGFESSGAIASWLPMFLFVILFGLSMDYHVFILSRVRELVDRGWTTRDAVREGVVSTAGTVTSAALVMVAVFSVFATLGQTELKQMGVGLATAILIDATIVRGVLLPAAMQLLGERNWYLPSWLEWLPRISWEAQVGPAATTRRARRERRARPRPSGAPVQAATPAPAARARPARLPEPEPSQVR